MTENPFATEQAWSVSEGTGSILPEGDHVVEILSCEGSGTSSGGYPQLELQVGNADGQIRDWIVVIPSTIGKVVQLTDAAGLERPNEAQVLSEGPGYRLDPKYLDQLVGRQVGVLVRQEPDRNDPTRMRDRVKGYVTAGSIAKSDIPQDPSIPASPSVVDDDDIPF
jgi:hypothetical protein